MKEILIENGTIINEGRSYIGYILIRGERIAEVGEGDYQEKGGGEEFKGERIDATDRIVMPGVIDDQVHFREPGLTHKGTIHSESIAAIAGGTTSYMEMPNTNPATTSHQMLEQKNEIAANSSVANYSFYLGATNDNIDEIKKVNPKHTCGVKVFMGSSTGNMLVDDDKALSAIFAESPVLIATHCESESIIRANVDKFKAKYGDQVTPNMHQAIRSAEACYNSSVKAVELAHRYGSELHLLHLSTARELSLLDTKPLEEKKITSEVCIHHLWFSYNDYFKKGNLIKWNPSIKRSTDTDSLRIALLKNKIDLIATDHAPHTLEEKMRPYWDCPSGGPMVQHSLVAAFELCRLGMTMLEKVVEKMCHAPAIRFGVVDRGFLREGAYADVVIVDPNTNWTVSKENILYKCGWSPFEGREFSTKVDYTIVNGAVVNRLGEIDKSYRGKALTFDR